MRTDESAAEEDAAHGAELPDEHPQRRREYSGPASTLGVAALVIVIVGFAIWFFEFRPAGESGSLHVEGLGIVDAPGTSQGPGPAAREGRIAPDFRLATTTGGELRLSDLRGRFVLVNFWASWCGPCRAETPELQRLAEATQAGRLTIVGVNQQETREQAAEFAAQFGVTYPLVLDRTGEVSIGYSVGRGLPVSLLIDPSGKVVRIYLGEMSADALAQLRRDYAS